MLQQIQKLDTLNIEVTDVTSNTISLAPNGTNLQKVIEGEVYAIAVHAIANVSKGSEIKRANVSDACRNGAYLEIATEGKGKEITKLPVSLLNPDKNHGRFVEIYPRKIDFTTSQIVVPDVSVLSLNTVFIISFLYR